MNSLAKLFRMLWHPYLIKRALMRQFEEKDSDRHKKRLHEYSKYYCVLEDVLPSLSIKLSLLKNVYVELNQPQMSKFLYYIEEQEMSKPKYNYLTTYNGLIIYTLIRLLKPETVIETGVASGYSTSYILKAMKNNNKGRLYSIDLHARNGVTIPHNKQLGWVVPQNLRDRWTLKLGESEKVLPELFKELETIDIFFHDSRHLYKTQTLEYTLAYPHIKQGGLLMSDDVTGNDAFIDFADSINHKPMMFGKIAVIQK